MGFLDRFLKEPEPEPALLDPPPTAANLDFGVAVEVVGESFYAGAISAATVRGRNHIACLLHEPNNEHDKKAVGVFIGNDKVGHLSRDHARSLRGQVMQCINRDGYAATTALIVGRDTPGVVLCADRIEPFSATGIRLALEEAGFNMPGEDRAGAAVKADGQRFRVMWVKSNSSARESMTTKMAKALREAGYQARKASDDGYPIVLVTLHSPTASSGEQREG